MLKVTINVGAKRRNGTFPGRETLLRVFLIAPIKYDFPVLAVPWIIMRSGSTLDLNFGQG